MRVLGILGTAIVFLLLVSRMPAYSQERDETKQDQTQEQKDKAKNNDKDKARQDDKARKPDDAAKQNERDNRNQPDAARQQEQNRQEQRQGQRQDQRDEHQAPVADQGRGENRGDAHRGRHIDDDKFRASFGREHVFHVDRTRIINSPQPIVVYGGYQFQLVDAWPRDWDYDDAVYVDYIDGEYFLFNPRHPEVRIAVFVLE